MKRKANPSDTPASDAGVVFPLVDGQRSTLDTGQRIVASASRRIDTAIHEAARDEPDWRSQYVRHFREVTRLSAQQHGLLIASDGLTAVHEEFRNRRHGREVPIADALTVPKANFLHTWSLAGAGRVNPKSRELVVPYRGEDLSGDRLRHRIDQWVEHGIAEPSCAEALNAVIDNPDWLDLNDLTAVVLGAGAEMGPYRPFLEWGAHVVAVDLPTSDLWSRLLATASASPGSLTLPLRRPLGPAASHSQVADNAGVDVITEAPEVAAWLAGLPGPYLLGDYLYAPGSTHVRSAVAVDAIIRHLLGKRDDIGLAYLATPTDVYAVSADVVDYSRQSLSDSNVAVTAARGLSGGRLYRPNYPTIESTTNGLRFGLADALVPQQGANYALAKRIQRWRALLARVNGSFVSINVAPATRTHSVLRNRLLAAAYTGAHRFGLEVFEGRTSSTLMAALLVHDLRNRTSSAHPDVPLDDSFDLLLDHALHGGMWRAPFAPRSVLGLAVAAGMIPRS